MVSTRCLAGTLLALVVSVSSQTIPGTLNLRHSPADAHRRAGSSRQVKTNALSRRTDRKDLARIRGGRKTALPAANVNPIFPTAPAYDSGGQQPSSIAVGDFNDDGKLDLAVVNSSNVAVLIGNGDGTYQPAVTYATSASPTYVVVADFNGDGIPDLAVGAGTIIDVFLAKGDGTFRAAVSYNSGGFDTPSLAVGDFNHDGKLDLVAAHTCADSNCNNSSISLLLGNGDGTFQSPNGFVATGEIASSVAVGDFNGDGKLDIAVAGDSTTTTSAEHDVIDILLGNGDGTFQPAVPYDAAGVGNGTIEGFSTSLALGDFNSDGKLDLAVADIGNCVDSKTSCTGGTVNVLLNNGDGTFQPAVSYSAGDDVFALTVGDINGDGRLDLIVTNFCGLSDCTDYRDQGTVSVLLGNGDGTFLPSIAFNATAGGGPASLVAGDFNHDGKLDLAVANQESFCCTDGSVAILLGDGNGTFQTTSSFSTGGYGGVSVLVGDFNGDGKADLVVGSSCYADSCINDSWLSVLPGNGDGTFGVATTYQFYGGGYQPAFIASDDFNHDGKLDLVATGANGNYGTTNLAGVSVFLGNGMEHSRHQPFTALMERLSHG